MTRWMDRAMIAWAAGALALGSALALEQEAPPPPLPPAGQTERASPEPAPLPDLDELLGLPSQKAGEPGAPSGQGAKSAHEIELERRLAATPMEDNFKVAVQLMADAASRLASAKDLGVETQRVQEEAIRRLDALIAAAKEQQGKKGGSSSSSQQQQQQSDPKQSPSQQKAQQQAQGQAGAGDNQGEATPPGMQTGALKDTFEAAAAAWGALPERVRESLLQGMGDKFSSMYDAMTREYYRRLAEERRDGP